MLKLLAAEVGFGINNNICYLIASTNVETFPAYSNWKCVDNVPVTNPCNYTLGQWLGVYCYGINTEGLISEIALDLTYPITGSLPPELGFITSLDILSAPFHNLHGPIPNSYCNWIHISNMQLLSNSFTGTIPSCFGNLTNLATLDISYNKFTGTIPNQIGLLTKLQYLILEYNSLNYTIPNDISTLSKLYSIYLNNNQLSGIYSCYIIIWIFLINRFIIFGIFIYRYHPNIFR